MPPFQMSADPLHYSLHPSQPERPLVIHGKYRPLSLPEIHDALNARSSVYPHDCTVEFCTDRWGGLQYHLDELRHVFGPHVHLLDDYLALQLKGQVVYFTTIPPSYPIHRHKVSQQSLANQLMAFIPRRLNSTACPWNVRLEARLMDPSKATRDDWFSFLEPYSMLPEMNDDYESEDDDDYETEDAEEEGGRVRFSERSLRVCGAGTVQGDRGPMFVFAELEQEFTSPHRLQSLD